MKAVGTRGNGGVLPGGPYVAWTVVVPGDCGESVRRSAVRAVIVLIRGDYGQQLQGQSVFTAWAM